LASQLQRRYPLAADGSTQGRRPEGLFYDALLRASQSLRRDENAVLVVVDGLDEMFGPGRRRSNIPPTIAFPARLPPRCKVILTSRPGAHLQTFSCLQCCETIDLGHFPEENERDIAQWLVRENEKRKLRL